MFFFLSGTDFSLVSSSLKIFLHSLLMACLLIAGGSHWSVVQTVAWVGMFVRFSQESSFLTSFERTFSGEEPCPLCHLVAEKGTDSNPGETTLPPSLKALELDLPWVFRLPLPEVLGKALIPTLDPASWIVRPRCPL